jgi:hypothetical protein
LDGFADTGREDFESALVKVEDVGPLAEDLAGDEFELGAQGKMSGLGCFP